jgi:hypothetical protein
MRCGGHCAALCSASIARLKRELDSSSARVATWRATRMVITAWMTCSVDRETSCRDGCGALIAIPRSARVQYNATTRTADDLDFQSLARCHGRQAALVNVVIAVPLVKSCRDRAGCLRHRSDPRRPACASADGVADHGALDTSIGRPYRDVCHLVLRRPNRRRRQCVERRVRRPLPERLSAIHLCSRAAPDHQLARSFPGPCEGSGSLQKEDPT